MPPSRLLSFFALHASLCRVLGSQRPPSNPAAVAGSVQRWIVNLVDVSLAAIGLVLAAPLMLLTAVAVRIGSAGPILYCQERVGENGCIFTLCKFRSMHTDAETGTPIWARDKDDRVATHLQTGGWAQASTMSVVHCYFDAASSR